MTYIDLLNDFNQWLESNVLAASSQLMYFKLLNVFNRAGWPEYVQVDNRRLMVMIGSSSEKTAIRARDELVRTGFIRYTKGRKGTPNYYQIHCKKYSIYDSINDSISYSKSDSESDSINDSHIKTKNKTKTNTPVLPNGNTAPKGRMTPPTVDEVAAYCRERGNGIDPEAFVDFYASKGWMVGKNPMKDWKAAVRTWERSGGSRGSGSGGYQKQTKAQELDDFYSMVKNWADAPDSGGTYG